MGSSSNSAKRASTEAPRSSAISASTSSAGTGGAESCRRVVSWIQTAGSRSGRAEAIWPTLMKPPPSFSASFTKRLAFRPWVLAMERSAAALVRKAVLVLWSR